MRGRIDHIQHLLPDKQPAVQGSRRVHHRGPHGDRLRQLLKLPSGADQISQIKYQHHHRHHTDHSIQNALETMPPDIDPYGIDPLEYSPSVLLDFFFHLLIILPAADDPCPRFLRLLILLHRTCRRIGDAVQRKLRIPSRTDHPELSPFFPGPFPQLLLEPPRRIHRLVRVKGELSLPLLFRYLLVIIHDPREYAPAFRHMLHPVQVAVHVYGL